MAKFFRHWLDQVDSPPDVPIGPLKGGKFAKQRRAHAVLNGLDKVPGMGRRVVFSSGLMGSGEFSTGIPSPTTERRVGDTTLDLTPGCVLAAGCLYLPSGLTSPADGAGKIQIDVTWTDRDGDQSVTQHVMNLDASSGGTYSDDPWDSLNTKRIALIAPSSMVSISTAREWSRYTRADVSVSYLGRPRVVDFVLHERPYTIALEADDDDDYWVSGMFATQRPGGDMPNLEAPLQRMSETTQDGNRRGGTWQIMDQAAAQAKLIGPMLWHWCGHTEDSDSATAADDNYIGGEWTSANWYRIPDAASSTNPLALAGFGDKGFGVASGSYARPVRYNDPVAMENNGVIPVRIHARLATNTESSTGPFEIRCYSGVGTGSQNYISITGTASSTPDWYSGYGYIECGRGPGDNANATVIANVPSGSEGLRVYDLCCYKAEHPRAPLPP